MTKDDLINWMESEGYSNEWLADLCGVKLSTVNSWRSNRPIPSKALIVIKAHMEKSCLEKKTQQQDIQNTLVMHISREQFRSWNQAALDQGKLIEDWALDGLDAKAEEYFSESPLKALDRVAEDATPYTATRTIIDPAAKAELDRNASGGGHSTVTA